MANLIRKHSAIHGFGIFAASNILKGEVLYKAPMDSILPAPKRRCAFIGNERWLNDPKVLNWINHSCDPNALFDIAHEQPRLVALRNIFAGEEITCDYDRTEMSESEVNCNCGSLRCRKKFHRIE